MFWLRNKKINFLVLTLTEARIFLLVDLREENFRFRVRGTKKINKKAFIYFFFFTLKNTQTDPQKCIILFKETNIILSQRIKYKNNFRNYYIFSTLRKITVGGFVNQLIKQF